MLCCLEARIPGGRREEVMLYPETFDAMLAPLFLLRLYWMVRRAQNVNLFRIVRLSKGEVICSICSVLEDICIVWREYEGIVQLFGSIEDNVWSHCAEPL